MSDSSIFIGYDDGDVDTNRTSNPHLSDLVASRLSRRQTLRGGVSAMATALFGGVLLAGCDDDSDGADGLLATASAGSTATTAGKQVALTGAVTSGTTSNVNWRQTSGPAVQLAGANTLNASFTAPAVTAATPLGFRLELTGADGSVTNNDVTVTAGPAVLDFTAVGRSLADQVTVPAGYTATVLYRLGDPIAAGVPAYANDGTDTNFAQRAGDHHDGMTYFGLAATGSTPDYNNSSRGLLALNHENISQRYLHVGAPTTTNGARPEGEAIKEIEAHGVSVVEVVRANGTWSYVPTSPLNRRITPNTPMSINGPVRGHPWVRTRYSADGTASRGTINNCANGTMPWGCYLTNEENWAGYFRRDRGDAAVRTANGLARQNQSLTRYGTPENRAGNYGWATATAADSASTVFARWNTTASASLPADGTGDFRNESFTFGWVVEIDPYDPTSTPRKRTALGRMNHEGCEVGRTIAGVRPAFYMGDDAQNEYIYKFVSATPWATADATATNRLAIGDKYLDAGTLYVARFNPDGSGTWLPLVFGQNQLTGANPTYGFADQADVLLNTRIAADILGATRMDRPEWTAVNPATGEMYCTLTNNSQRTSATADPSNPRAYSDPKAPQGDQGSGDPVSPPARPTNGNANGHIVRVREAGDSSEATSFTWDIYAFGAGADLDAANVNLSALDATNDFSSPDGLWFGLRSNVTGQATPIMWIETDDGAYTDQTNCMLLAAIPGTVGDGGTRTVTNSLNGQTSTVTTRVGRTPGAQLKRFLVGPKECEITGIYSTPDGRSLFVNVQHPGEDGGSTWPAATAGSRPRSSTIVITKDDSGIVGI